jgi:hypothetical protein
MKVTLDIPEKGKKRVLDAVAGMYGYQDEVTDPEKPEKMVKNPESKDDFLKRHLTTHLQEIVTAHEARQEPMQVNTEGLVS